MNIHNFAPCPNCKNNFLKTHLRMHFMNCKKTKINANINNNTYDNANINNNNSNINNNPYINSTKNTHSNTHSNTYSNTHSNTHSNTYTNKYTNTNTNTNTYANTNTNTYANTNTNTYANTNTKPKNSEEPKMELEKYVSPQLVSYNDSILNHFFNNYDKLFAEFVSDKCIALVGPAQSILNTGKGSVIDKFDLVVRLNKSLPLPDNIKSDIGSRTDIIYNSLNTSDFPGENNLNPKLYKKYGVKFVASSYPFNHRIFHDDILHYVMRYKFELPLKVMGDVKFRNFEKQLGTRPYTGTCAIMDLLSYPIKYLYITGLDFYQTKYYSEYRSMTKGGLKNTKNSPIHQAKPQLDYLKNLSLFENRIILDNYLDKLLYHDYYKVVNNLKAFSNTDIFNFGDPYFKQYFEMKLSNTTFTREYKNSFHNKDLNNNNNNNNSFIVFTDNKYFMRNVNDYCILITNNSQILHQMNQNTNPKKFIGNFYFTDNRQMPHTINLTSRFLGHLKSVLLRIHIHNCTTYLVILLSIMLYLPDKHYFLMNEVYNNWKLTHDEKKLLLFLHKKKILNLI